MDRNSQVFAALLVCGLIATGCGPNKKEAEALCRNNMEILWGAAESYALENRKDSGSIISPADLKPYMKDGRILLCPLSHSEYAPFTVSQGPRCPNDPAHSAALISSACEGNRMYLWDVAISYCREKHLGWENPVSWDLMTPPFDSQIFTQTFSQYPKYGHACPLGTNHYPAFVLRDGPKCPNSEAHNAVKTIPRFNAKYFDQAGNVVTNALW